MKNRLRKSVTILSLILIAGIAYGLLYFHTGTGIPCIFHELTGLFCPGCGITRMCVYLMQGEIIRAMESNHMLFFLSPFFLYILAGYILRYIRIGKWVLPLWQSIAVYIFIGLLVIYTVFRNIFR